MRTRFVFPPMVSTDVSTEQLRCSFLAPLQFVFVVLFLSSSSSFFLFLFFDVKLCFLYIQLSLFVLSAKRLCWTGLLSVTVIPHLEFAIWFL